MIAPVYRSQVDLLLRVLPHVAEEDVFALKGGTAINLFLRDMPRLSVDIDLTYIPFDHRGIAMKNIAAALRRIVERLRRTIPGIQVASFPQGDGKEARLNCRFGAAQIKIEVNTIMRGHLWPPRLMQLSGKVQTEFGMFAAMNVVSTGELYGGKICAALDRQYPRRLVRHPSATGKRGHHERNPTRIHRGPHRPFKTHQRDTQAEFPGSASSL